MKKFIKKIRERLEKLLAFKFTRSLVLDLSQDIYKKHAALQKEVNNLRNNSYCRATTNSNDNTSFYKEEFLLASDIWKKNGASTPLENRLEYLSQSTMAWKNCPHEIWLIYTSILLEKGNETLANEIWKRYLQTYPERLEWLHRYIIVSKFATQQGVTNENIVKAAAIYDELTNSRKEKAFENLLINAKSIAIVGNGPSEKGLKRGKEIDEHDIVIRFNNFTTYGYEEDYGNKTNVWIKCSNDDVKHAKDICNYQMIVYEADYMHHPMEHNYHNYIYHDMQQGVKTDHFDYDLHMELRKLLGGFPSTGLLTVWLVAKLGLMYKTDIYGFSFLQKQITPYASHYFNDRDKQAALKKSSHHNFDFESNFVRGLLSGEYENEYPINDKMNQLIYENFLSQKKEKEICENITQIHSITHRPFAPNGGSGGGGAVLSCQKTLIGNKYKNLECKYTFFESNRYTRLKGLSDLHDLWGGALFAIQHTADEKNTIYVTHDYGTAFGLYLMGKNYVYVNHLQGPRLEEKTNFGEKFSEKSAKIIQQCEKLVCENACYVCFPSIGAAEYFENSNYQCVDLSKYRRGPVLYNTLYASPSPEKIDNIEKDENSITILSVGQLTYAKGIDQCVDTIAEVLKKTEKKVRWIIVGKGPLKDEILEKCEIVKSQHEYFEYIHIEKCVYQEMLYLQDISDIYMMRQRISIFDLTTLELMRKGKIIVLSDVGGNPEFNIDNNIILHRGNDIEVAINILESIEKDTGKYNLEIFEKHFSNKCFVDSYQNMFEKMLEDVKHE